MSPPAQSGRHPLAEGYLRLRTPAPRCAAGARRGRRSAPSLPSWRVGQEIQVTVLAAADEVRPTIVVPVDRGGADVVRLDVVGGQRAFVLEPPLAVAPADLPE